MSYRQLTLAERYQIEALVSLKIGGADIARRLGRHASTISRELKRNAKPTPPMKPYQAAIAARLTHGRRVLKGERSRKIQGALQELVEQKLRLSWSPEQISGRLRLEKGPQVSHETIYQHVLRDAAKRGFLRYCLRFAGYKHHRFRRSRAGAQTRMRKRWIDQRPEAANDRSELGHWERDCVLGQRGGAALLTFVDRRSRLTLVRRVKKVNSRRVATATLDALAPHGGVSKTITNDNGSEFQRDEAFERRIGLPIYFTEPSSPWQRGSIENLNGLIRQYVPKGVDIDALHSLIPNALEETLNFRPRKTLGFRAPQEVFLDKNVQLMAGPLMRLGLEFSGRA